MSYNRALSRYAAALTILASTCVSGRVARADGPGYDTNSDLLQRQFGGFFEEHRLKLEGHAEAGITFNTEDASNSSNGTGRYFDVKYSDPTLNQIGLTFSRAVSGRADEFDIGFKFDIIYGADAAFTQANGTNFYGSAYANEQSPFTPAQPVPNPPILAILPGQEYPQNQFDVLQGFMEFQLPFGPGVVLTAGKFVTPWGVEKINPTQNTLYSHSYIFGVSQPRTLTGVTARGPINEKVTVMGGLVVGWDQSLEDNNSTPSIVAQVAFQEDPDLRFVLSAIAGPEQPDETSDWRYLLDGTVEWQPHDHVEWALGAEAVIGYEGGASTGYSPGGRVWLGDDSYWLGVAGYASYRLDLQGAVVLNLRGEYFNDAKGVRQVTTEVYALTAGVRIVPCPKHEFLQHMVIRPEIRWDWANDAIFNDLSEKGQITLGADIIFEF